MINSNLKLSFGLFTATVILALTSFYVFYFVPASVALSNDAGVIGHASPELFLANELPLAQLEIRSVEIDGARSEKFEVIKAGGIYKLKLLTLLADGRHVVKLSGAVGSIAPSKFSSSRSFIVDTTAPAINLFDYDDLIAIRGSGQKTLYGESEAGAKIYLSDQKQNSLPIKVDSSGHFKIYLSNIIGEGGSADLVISVVDGANNRSKKKLRAISDAIPPEVEPINFTPNKNYFDPSMSPKVSVSDIGSKIKFTMLEINGNKQINSEATIGQSGVNSMLVNGTNRINVISYDIAGNTTRSSYNIDLYTMNMVVDIKARTLKYYEGDKLIKTYRVSIGAEGYATPKGKWKIIKKRKNPTWYNPNSEWSKTMPPTIGPGPGNPLGTRALYLNVPEIRIHGTYRAGSVGTAMTHGCIRLSMSDLEELYEIVPVGTPIRVY